MGKPSDSSQITAERTGAQTPTRNPARAVAPLLPAFLVFAAFLAGTVYYFVWRLAVVNWALWWVGVPLLLAEVFSVFNTLGLQYTAWPRPVPQICANEDPFQFPVCIMIPTVNEGTGILEQTLQGALRARARYLQAHPQAEVSIVVCNDGRVAGVKDWPEVEALAARLGVQCITRTVPGGAKAGNIEHARQAVGATGSTLIALFDADMVAEPDFLIQAIPPFADPTVGWVQTGQYYRNQGSAVARWAHDQQILFYRMVCVGKAAVNGAFICGTNVVIRAGALDTIGGLPQNTVTEDLAASILLHPNWRSLYLTDVLALGLGPEDLGAYFSQQRRWAAGTFAVLFRHWRSMLLPGHRGLTLPQRLQYLHCCGHFFSGFRDLVCLAAPLAYLLLGFTAFRVFSISSFLLHFLPYWILSLFVFWYVTRGKAGFRAILHGSILGFGCFPIFVSAFFSAAFSRRLQFVITAKRRQKTGGWRRLVPQAALTALGVAGMVRFACTGNRSWLGLISELWMLYVVLLLSGMLWLGAAENPEVERKVVRANLRYRPAFVATGISLAAAAVLVLSQQGFGRPLSVPRPPAEIAAILPAELEGVRPCLVYAINTRGQVVGIADGGDLLGPFHLFPLSLPTSSMPTSSVRLSSAKTRLPLSEHSD